MIIVTLMGDNLHWKSAVYCLKIGTATEKERSKNPVPQIGFLQE